MFQRPKALAMFHLGGLEGPEAVEKVQALLGEGHTWTAGLGSGADVASPGSLLAAAGDLAAANPDITLNVLDHSALQGCSQDCLADHLEGMAQRLGGQLVRGGGGAGPDAARPSKALSGALQLPGGGALDLAQPAGRLLGIELGALAASAAQRLQPETLAAQGGDLHVYEGTLLGLQAVAAAGDGSASAAAQAALLQVLGLVKQQLDEAYGGDVLYQVTLLGDVPVASGQARHLLAWKDASRRTLLDAAGGGAVMTSPLRQEDPAAAAKRFSSKASAYSAGVLLLLFTFAALHCLTNMPFKQDTLLYGRTD